MSRLDRPRRAGRPKPTHRLGAVLERLEDRRLLAGTIGNLVWNDLNGNGLQDGGEPGVSGAVVELWDSGVVRQTAVTDAAGSYSLSGLLAGTSDRLRFRPPVGYGFTIQVSGQPYSDSDAGADGFSSTFTLGPGQDDLTRDAGLVRVSEQFPVQLGPRQVLLNNGAFGGFLNFPDMNITVLQRTPMLKLFVAVPPDPRGASYLLEGSDIQHLTKSTMVLSAGPAGSFDNGGAWCCGLYHQSDGSLYLFYHAEDHENIPVLSSPGFYASIAVAVSTDNGQSFTKLGQVITSSLPKDPNGRAAQGPGEASVVVDPTGRYLYAYYTYHSDQADGTQICLARADLSQGPPVPGAWKKYYNGSFSEPAQGGRETPVVRATGGSGHAINPSVSYSAFLGRYVMAYSINDYPEYDKGYPIDSGIYLAFSNDGVTWTGNRQILTAWSIPLFDHEIANHPSIVWDDADGASGAGWLVYGYSPRWGYNATESPYFMAGQRITLGAPQVAPLQSHLMAYEGFGYPAGDLDMQVSAASSGFDGLWTTQFGSSSVASGSLGYPSLPESGNHAIQGKDSRISRRLDVSPNGPFAAYVETQQVTEGGLTSTKSLIGAAGKTLYVSFIQDVSANDGFYAVEFQRADYSPDELDHNRILFVGFNTAWYCAESDYNGGITRPLGTPNTDPNLIVLKFEFGAGNQDRVSVYRNPSLSAEPSAPDGVLQGDFAFDRVTLADISSNTNIQQVDELRFGDSYLAALGKSINTAPTDITITSASVAENAVAGTTVGWLSTTDPDAGSTFTYAIVAGPGSADNASFRISGNQLVTNAVFHNSAKSIYSVRIRSTDRGGLFVEKQFTIMVVAGPRTTLLSLVTNVAIPTYGQVVTLTATVSPSSSGGPGPGGTVLFKVDGVDLGPAVTLVNGAATSIATTILGAGDHTITAVYSGDVRFAGNSASHGLTVAKAMLSVFADAKAKVYGAAVPILTATLSGFVNGDQANVIRGTPIFTTTATRKSKVGTYVITVRAGTLSAANYNFPTLLYGTLSVTKAPLTVTANDLRRRPGTRIRSLTFRITGFVNGDRPGVIRGKPTLRTVATRTSPIGQYPIIVMKGTLSATNYSFTFVNGTLAIAL